MISSLKIIVFNLILFSFSLTCFGQKKIIDHTSYKDWKKLSNAQISQDGNWISYEKNPYQGDGVVCWYNTKTHRVDSLARGNKTQISFDNSFIATLIQPYYDSLRILQLNGVKKDKLPKDSLAIVDLISNKVKLFPSINDFKLSKESGWIAYKSTEKKIEGKKYKKPKKKDVFTSDGKVLSVLEPKTGKLFQWENVKEYELSNKGNWVAYVTQKKQNKTDSLYLKIQSLTKDFEISLSSYTAIKKMIWSDNESQFAFLASRDTSKNNKVYNLYLYDLNSKTNKLVVDTNYAGISKQYTVSENGNISFSTNEKYLYFGTAKQPVQDKKDTLLEDEKAVLDIWNWKDERLQPRQLSELDKDKKKTAFSRIDIQTGILQVFENDTLEVFIDKTGEAKIALAYTNNAYKRSYDYAYPWKTDVYALNLANNTTSLLFKGISNNVSISPSGNKIVYFSDAKKNYISKNLEDNKEVCISCNLDENWYEQNNGEPHENIPFNVVGWIKGEKEVIIQSEFDLFLLNIDGSKKTRITLGQGKEQKQIMRLQSWDKDSLYIDLSRAWITGFNQETKFSSIYSIDIDSLKKINLTKTYSVYADISAVEKSGGSDQIIFRQSNFTEYPEVWSTNLRFEKPKRISETNPQQKNYNWASVQLVNWKTPSGEKLQGLLYTPEDLDPKKSYPMLVYFYELYSDEIHNYYAPRPTASIIFPTEYASAGYVVFIPDIRYNPGHPAQSAYDCIMSGTDYVLKKFSFIDSKRMGLQGQSWGGYQTAQLVTMTTRFKAAMAGAPVANMFSAYGGIRWGSGLSRQFQYERTQSRIGGSIWDDPELYVENSPLFGLPKVKTPLLIMHNDGDGSVPWYQGIELFMGLRRLNKPTWLLNYNGDDHNLMKEPNRMDLSIRMRQFFDYYLKDAPAPKWLIDGIPALDKGKVTGFELIRKP